MLGSLELQTQGCAEAKHEGSEARVGALPRVGGRVSIISLPHESSSESK